MPPRISVVINTLNEEKNLPFALRSVQSWVDEIVVVDMYSDDRTVEIARQFGAKVFFHERLGFADPARAFAIDQASGDWILVLDADEVVTLPVSKRLVSIASDDNADAVLIPWLDYMLGAPMMHTKCDPRKNLHLRFFKKTHVKATPTIHNYLQVAPGSRILQLAYEPGLAVAHFACVDLGQMMEKINRYTDIEARQARERGERTTPVGALVKAARDFVVRYVVARGFQDGWRGFYVSLFSAFYWIAMAAKLQELTVPGDGEPVESRYRREAEEILKAYGEPPPPVIPAPVTAGK